jgi:hypothetical protein
MCTLAVQYSGHCIITDVSEDQERNKNSFETMANDTIRHYNELGKGKGVPVLN